MGERVYMANNRSSLFLLIAVVAAVGLTAAACGRGPGLTTDDTNNQQQDNGSDVQTPNGLDVGVPDLGSGGNPNLGVPPQSGLGLPDSVASQPILDAEVQRATESVVELQDDVVLKLVSMKFINSYSDQTGLSTNYYIFASPSNPQYYYLVNVPRNGDRIKRFIMPVDDLELQFDLLDLPFQFWSLSYIDAIKAAETVGAKEFVEQHPQFDLSLILAQPAGQYLNWFLTYRATDGSGAVLKVAVDSYGGTASIVR